MAFKVFQRQIPSDDSVEDELNRFMAAHKVLSVQTQWVTRDAVPWLVYVLESAAGGGGGGGVTFGGLTDNPARIDYQKLLKPEDFKVYAALRDLRRKLADEEKVKPFVVFTNAQLAAMATGRPASLEALGKIEGVGEARVGKYGGQVLAVLGNETTAPPANERI
ncbi:MAG: HRDC domain-containing protein [Opitutaceae bacterium]|jgi:superfamily II DNA helicase RecQ|nr:HRDC domain-containing protein [Opitutaceae bacterium]